MGATDENLRQHANIFIKNIECRRLGFIERNKIKKLIISSADAEGDHLYKIIKYLENLTVDCNIRRKLETKIMDFLPTINNYIVLMKLKKVVYNSEYKNLIKKKIKKLVANDQHLQVALFNEIEKGRNDINCVPVFLIGTLIGVAQKILRQ